MDAERDVIVKSEVTKIMKEIRRVQKSNPSDCHCRYYLEPKFICYLKEIEEIISTYDFQVDGDYLMISWFCD